MTSVGDHVRWGRIAGIGGSRGGVEERVDGRVLGRVRGRTVRIAPGVARS